MATVTVITDEAERGCGYRRKGFYLIGKGTGRGCGKLPFPLTVCPCCGNGIKHSLGWTWINAAQLMKDAKCKTEGDCQGCPLHCPPEKMGLLWIGESFYKTPADWIKEGVEQGISRRISGVPRGFKVGVDWVAVAHKKAISNPDGTFTPAIFYVFQPTEVQYVIDGTESEDELNEMERRGLKLVKLERTDGEGQPAVPFRRFRRIDPAQPGADRTIYTACEGRIIIESLDRGTRFKIIIAGMEGFTERNTLASAKKYAVELVAR